MIGNREKKNSKREIAQEKRKEEGKKINHRVSVAYVLNSSENRLTHRHLKDLFTLRKVMKRIHTDQSAGESEEEYLE